MLDRLNFFEEHVNRGASVELRMTWITLLLAIRWKNKKITFSWNPTGREKSVRLDDIYQTVPPPHHLFPRISEILREIGSKAAIECGNLFSFTYNENANETVLEWLINYDTGHDVYYEIDRLMNQIHGQEEAERMAKAKKT